MFQSGANCLKLQRVATHETGLCRFENADRKSMSKPLPLSGDFRRCTVSEYCESRLVERPNKLHADQVNIADFFLANHSRRNRRHRSGNETRVRYRRSRNSQRDHSLLE